MAGPHPVHAIQARWAALGAREQRGLLLAAVVLGAALVWSVALAPALRTLRNAEAQNAQLGATLERMLALQARAKLLQAQPAPAPQETLKALQAAAAALGQSASLQVVGEQATLRFERLSAPSLAAWLVPATGLGSSPAQAQLQRIAGSEPPLWSGSLVFRLPANPNPAP